MTLPTWNSVFTDDLSTISAAFLNDYVRTQIPKALDGVGGSNSTPSTPATPIEIGGSGVEMSGPFVLTSGGDMDVETGVTAQFQSGSTLDIDDGATVARQGREILTGAGATTAWRMSNGTDADGTYDVSTDVVRIPASLCRRCDSTRCGAPRRQRRSRETRFGFGATGHRSPTARAFFARAAPSWSPSEAAVSARALSCGTAPRGRLLSRVAM
jgi:hypothetical protein